MPPNICAPWIWYHNSDLWSILFWKNNFHDFLKSRIIPWLLLSNDLFGPQFVRSDMGFSKLITVWCQVSGNPYFIIKPEKTYWSNSSSPLYSVLASPLILIVMAVFLALKTSVMKCLFYDKEVSQILRNWGRDNKTTAYFVSFGISQEYRSFWSHRAQWCLASENVPSLWNF